MTRSPIFDSKHVAWQTWLQVIQLARTGRGMTRPFAAALFLLALGVVCAVAALVGGVLVRQMGVARAPLTAVVPTGHVAEAGGLLLQMVAVTWLIRPSTVGHRLRVDVKLQNPTDRVHAVRPQEFRLRTRSGASWPASEDSISTTTLGPQQILTGALHFDVPATVSGVELVWTRERHEMHLPIGEDGSSHPRRRNWEEVKEVGGDDRLKEAAQIVPAPGERQAAGVRGR